MLLFKCSRAGLLVFLVLLFKFCFLRFIATKRFGNIFFLETWIHLLVLYTGIWCCIHGYTAIFKWIIGPIKHHFTSKSNIRFIYFPVAYTGNSSCCIKSNLLRTCKLISHIVKLATY